VVREGFPEEITPALSPGIGVNCLKRRRSVCRKENRKCKGPEAEEQVLGSYSKVLVLLEMVGA
jgi:hypothetical protein